MSPCNIRWRSQTKHCLGWWCLKNFKTTHTRVEKKTNRKYRLYAQLDSRQNHTHHEPRVFSSLVFSSLRFFFLLFTPVLNLVVHTQGENIWVRVCIYIYVRLSAYHSMCVSRGEEKNHFKPHLNANSKANKTRSNNTQPNMHILSSYLYVVQLVHDLAIYFFLCLKYYTNMSLEDIVQALIIERDSRCKLVKKWRKSLNVIQYNCC